MKSARLVESGFVRALVSVGVVLADDIHETFAAGKVEAFARNVVKQVVGVRGDGEVGNRLPVGSVEDDKARRLPAPDKQPVVPFVQRHREVGFELGHRPRRGDSLLSRSMTATSLASGTFMKIRFAERFQWNDSGGPEV